MKLLDIYLKHRFKKHIWGKHPKKDVYWAHVGLSLNQDFTKISINENEHFDERNSLAFHLSQKMPNLNEKIIDNLIAHKSWTKLEERERNKLWISLLKNQNPFSVLTVKKIADHWFLNKMNATAWVVLKEVLPHWFEKESFTNVVDGLTAIQELYSEYGTVSRFHGKNSEEYLEWIMKAIFHQVFKEHSEDKENIKIQSEKCYNLLTSIENKEPRIILQCWFNAKDFVLQKFNKMWDFDKDLRAPTLKQKIILNALVEVFLKEDSRNIYFVQKTLLIFSMNNNDMEIYRNKKELSLKNVLDMDFYLSQSKGESILKEELSVNIPKISPSNRPTNLSKSKRL